MKVQSNYRLDRRENRLSKASLTPGQKTKVMIFKRMVLFN